MEGRELLVIHSGEKKFHTTGSYLYKNWEKNHKSLQVTSI